MNKKVTKQKLKADIPKLSKTLIGNSSKSSKKPKSYRIIQSTLNDRDTAHELHFEKEYDQ